MYLGMIIEFTKKDGNFKIDTNIKNDEQLANIIENFLYRQIGKGIDERKVIEKDIYHFVIKWYPENDNIIVLHDTGNLGLRDGILKYILSRLG